MRLLQWLFRNRSARSLALSFYKRGLARTKKHDHQGAMQDFTDAIESPSAPDDVRAMALYNRALLFAAANNFSAAVVDLTAVLAMAAPLREIKQAARRRLDRMQYQRSLAGGSISQSGKANGLESNAAG